MILFGGEWGGRFGGQRQLGAAFREREREGGREQRERVGDRDSLKIDGPWTERNVLSSTAQFLHSLLLLVGSTHIGEVKLGVRGVGTAVGGHVVGVQFLYLSVSFRWRLSEVRFGREEKSELTLFLIF